MLNNILLDTVTANGISGINEEVVQQHWNNIIELPQLQQDETVRLVVMPAKDSNMYKKMNMEKGTGAFTDTTQIRSCAELINRMRTFSIGEEVGKIGFALSAGIYVNEEKKAPNYGQLKYIKNMIIDIDAHINEKSLERFNMSLVDPKYIKYSSINILNYINQLFLHNGVPAITPKYAAMTGGGFQFCLTFDKFLDRPAAQKVFETFGSILGTVKDTGNLSEKDKKAIEVNNKLKESMSFNNQITSDEAYALKKKKGISSQVKTLLGEWFQPFFEIDNSFKDVVHCQRVIGTVNQKYSAYSYIDNNLIKDSDYLKNVITPIKEDIFQNTQLTDIQKDKINEHYLSTYKLFNNLILSKNPESKYSVVNADSIAMLSGIIQTANNNKRHEGIDYINLTEIEKQILRHFDKEGVKMVLQDLGIQIVKDTGNYIACRSPFREDNNPSLAVYLNHDKSIIKDFTEDKTYNLITLWIAVTNCTKSDAIEQMSFKYGIKLEKADKKEFAKIQTAETALEFIQEINVTDYIYYRLANKTRTCIIKNVKTSEEALFDGSRVLSDHILINQLGVKHPDKDFRDEFWHLFEQYILIDAFEIFEPGSEKTLIHDNIRKVNNWSANESYLKCWAESESLEQMNLTEAIDLIKETCPTIYLYLLQITQKGDLGYFVNWLNCLAKFKYTSTIPIFTSIEGTGKNLFVQDVLAPYLNQNYISIANGQQMTSNFNSFMATTNLIVADEGDFTGSRDFDQLKMFSGNPTFRVEKKGVDSVQMERKFNIIMFTNGESPVRHSISDRRISYYRLDHKLTKTLQELNYSSVNEFREKIKNEVHRFWGIIIKTDLKNDWTHNNIQNGIYHKQLLMMHPFGKLIIKILENDWDAISLQLNEKQRESNEEKVNMTLLNEIKENFFNGEGIPLILINKYLDAMSWKSIISIQQFISTNELHKYGISIQVDTDSIKIKIDAEKLQNWIFQENNLVELIPQFKERTVKTLQELKEEHYQTKGIVSAVTRRPSAPGITPPNNMPGLNMPSGVPNNMPSGVPNNMPSGIPGMNIPGGIPQVQQ